MRRHFNEDDLDITGGGGEEDKEDVRGFSGVWQAGCSGGDGIKDVLAVVKLLLWLLFVDVVQRVRNKGGRLILAILRRRRLRMIIT